jgi:DNA-binding response OmpR family regulator
MIPGTHRYLAVTRYYRTEEQKGGEYTTRQSTMGISSSRSIVAIGLLIIFKVGSGWAPLKTNTRHHRCLSRSRNKDYLTRSKLSQKFRDGNVELDPEFEKTKDEQFRERNKRWLVLVDDEESIRMAVGDYLYDQGYKVTACADANALVEVVSTPPEEHKLPMIPDVIISDIRMPGRDGLELLQYVRGNKRLERVPVVLLTAKAFTADRIEGYNAGADVYLTKPFDPEELLAIVDNLIIRRQQMTGIEGRLTDLQEEMANIKQILKINGANVVQKTNVYLTLNEREVLELVCDGKMNSEIAQTRRVTPERIAGILQQMYFKTETRTRTELVRWALKTGYVSKRQ